MEWLPSIYTITWDGEGCLTDSMTSLPPSSFYKSKRSFDNKEDGMKELCSWLHPMEKPVVVYEPTAHLHRDLVSPEQLSTI